MVLDVDGGEDEVGGIRGELYIDYTLADHPRVVCDRLASSRGRHPIPRWMRTFDIS